MICYTREEGVSNKNPKYNKISVYWRLSAYLKAQMYLAMNNDELALEQYMEAVKRYNDVEAGLMMVAEVGTYSSSSNALSLLNKVELIFKQQSTSTLRRSRSEYEMEIMRLILI